MSKRIVLSVSTLIWLGVTAEVGASTIVYVRDQAFVVNAPEEPGLFLGGSVDIGAFDRPLNFFVNRGVVVDWRLEPSISWFHQYISDPDAVPSPTRFDFGDEIGGALEWTSQVRIADNLASSGSLSGTFYDTEGFLAVLVYEEEFGWENEELLPYYGWIQVSHSADDVALTVHDWAWNSTPGEPILAGQIPEPAAYAVMLAVGVLGIVILRRRRRNGSASA